MAATRRREREMVAVAFNQKEQRVLEKSLSTLRLEQDYSLKLLDLHNRTVKVNFRQLKDRVSRIKSYLTPEEISKLRQLEAEGKLRPMYPPVCLGNAMKIAAAARRLNSSYGHRSSPHPRAKSALPRVNLSNSGPHSHSSLAPAPGNLRRSNSVTGAFMDIPQPRNGHRPGSASEIVGRTSPAPEIKVTSTSGSKVAMLKPVTVNGKTGDAKHDHIHLRMDGTAKRLTSSGVRAPSRQSQHQPQHSQHQHQQPLSNSSSSSMDSSNSKRSNSKTSLVPSGADRARRQSIISIVHNRVLQNHARAPFSSHVVTEKEARERAEGEENGEVNHTNTASTPRSPHPHYHHHERNSSFSLNDDTVDSALGEDLYAERRAELLEEEQFRAANISKRKDAFLKEVDRYLREHPPLAVTMAERSLALSQNSPEDQQEEEDEDADKGLDAALFRRRRPLRVEFDATPTYLPEENYRDRLMGLWRDMNKCRYLRVPEEMIDLSGINTLAADTMKLFQVIKQQEMEPLSNAWKE